MNAIGRRFIGQHNIEMSVVPSRERNMFCQAGFDVWCECKSARALGTTKPVVFSYMTDIV